MSYILVSAEYKEPFLEEYNNIVQKKKKRTKNLNA